MPKARFLKGDEAYPVDRLEHSRQAATQALRDGRDEESVVCALLHDIGESLGPFRPRRPQDTRRRPAAGPPRPKGYAREPTGTA
jgi:predicted HD phosphohydrolase